MANTKERTLVLLKPDAVQRNLVGEIFGRFERAGFKIVAVKFLLSSKELAYKHYVKNEEELVALGNRSIEVQKKSGIETNKDPRELGKWIVDKLVKFLSASPIVAMVLEGNKAIPIVRKLVGSSDPSQSDPGTIRGDFTLDSYPLADQGNRAARNLVHASSSESDAEYEIKVWFKEEEIVNYKSIREKMLYDVNLDDITE